MEALQLGARYNLGRDVKPKVEVLCEHESRPLMLSPCALRGESRRDEAENPLLENVL